MFQISLSIPLNREIPAIISKFSPDENFLMIEIGSNAIQQIKNSVIENDHYEVKEQIQQELNEKYKMEIMKLNIINEYKISDCENKINLEKLEEMRLNDEITELRMNIEVQKQDNLLKLIGLENEYSVKLQEEKNKHQIMLLEIKQEKQRLEDHFDNLLIQKESVNMKKYYEKYDNLKELYNKTQNEYLHYKETNLKRELDKEKDANDKYGKTIEELNNKMNELKKVNPKIIGNKGEKLLEDLFLKTFVDFEEFELVNTSAKSHSGDFHLKFRHFNILVDCKKYTGGVDNISRDKLKSDLKKNSHIAKIAWMVSLDSINHKYNKANFMFSIDDGLCICYINSLLLQCDPSEMLKTIWYASKVLYDSVLNIDKSDITELDLLRKNEGRIKEQITNMLKTSKNSFWLLSQLKDNLEVREKELHEIMDNSILSIQEIYNNMVLTWWKINMEKKTNNKVKSNAIYDRFKKDNPNIEIRIDGEVFKMILLNIVEKENIIKPKTNCSQLQIINYSIKSV